MNLTVGVVNESMEDEDRYLTTSDIVEITGVKRPTLQYWIDKGLVEPVEGTRERADKIGMRFTLKSVQIAAIIAKLRNEHGISLQKISKAVENLKQIGRTGKDLVQANIFCDGHSIYEMEPDKYEVMTDMVDGEQMSSLDFFPLRETAREVQEEYRQRVSLSS